MEAVGERGGIDTSRVRKAHTVKQGYTGFQEGDIVIAKITPCFENGKGSIASGLLNRVGYGTTELHVLRPHDADRCWLFYVTQSHEFMGYGEGSMYGAGGQKRVPPEFVRDYAPPLPPLPTQKAIADFLDRKTATIDVLIEKKQKLLGLLAEKRAALINQAVTKGLDPGVPMKDSGIPWIGKIPAHWVICRLSFRFSQQLGKMMSSFASEGPDQAPYLANKDVQWDFVDVSDLKTMHFSPSERMKFSLIPEDLLVCEGGFIGRTAEWRGELEGCFFQKAIHRLRPHNPSRDHHRFFYFCMKTATEQGLFEEHGNKSTIGHLTGEALRSHKFPFPPMNEQIEIADWLDRHYSLSKKTSIRLTEQIDRLQEYRQVLITAAVTGRLDIPEEAA